MRVDVRARGLRAAEYGLKRLASLETIMGAVIAAVGGKEVLWSSGSHEQFKARCW
jgi:hypothetical protein